MNIAIMRAFVQLRELLATHKALAQKIEQLETTQKKHTGQLQRHGDVLVTLVQDIHKLKHPPQTRAIGFVYRPPKKQ